MYEKRRSDEFQLFGCKWSNSSQATTKTKIEMPKNGLVMRFFDYTRAGVGVVGAERSIQLSYDRTPFQQLTKAANNSLPQTCQFEKPFLRKVSGLRQRKTPRGKAGRNIIWS